MSRAVSRLERCLCRVIWALLIQEHRSLSLHPSRSWYVLPEEEQQEEEEQQGPPTAPSEALECCVCYELRAQSPAPCCARCGSRAPVCQACLGAWSLSTGRQKSCVICRSQGSVLARTSPSSRDPQEDYLTVFFLTYTCLQYLYIIWFLRTFVCTVQPYLF